MAWDTNGMTLGALMDEKSPVSNGICLFNQKVEHYLMCSIMILQAMRER